VRLKYLDIYIFNHSFFKILWNAKQLDLVFIFLDLNTFAGIYE